MKVIILSFRVSGNDGVSLEAHHWKEVLTEMGHEVMFMGGELDTEGIILPEMHFTSESAQSLHDRIFYKGEEFANIKDEIFKSAAALEIKITEELLKQKADLLVVLNVFAIPLHFPLTVALANVIGKLGIKTVARHHDFWWERERFGNTTIKPFLQEYYPFFNPAISHVVINSLAKKELMEKTGIDAEIIWDSFDFNNKQALARDEYEAGFREDFGIHKEDIVFLQPTRLVPRKRIEMAITFVKGLADPRVILVIAGRGGDEAGNYEELLREHARNSHIRHMFIGNRIDSLRGIDKGKKIYTLWDAYKNCDFVTYPTALEGFGNQFVESVFFKKPVIMTPYPVFESDIAPLGFNFIDMQKEDAFTEVRNLIKDKKEYKRMVEENFALGEKYFSYEWVKVKLASLNLSLERGLNSRPPTYQVGALPLSYLGKDAN